MSGVAITTTVNQTGEMLNLTQWINAAWMDIQMMREDWEWMRSSTAFPTVASRAVNTPTQCGLTDFGAWDRESFRNYANPVFTVTIASPGVVTLTAHGLSVGDTWTPYTTGALPTGFTSGTAYYVVSVPSADTLTVALTSGGTAINTSGSQSGTHTCTSNNQTTFIGFNTEVFMDYLDYEVWRDTYSYSANRQVQTRPLVVTITPNKSLGLGPYPSAGYTIVGDYFTVPSELSGDTDTPDMPTQFHMAIVYYAMMQYGGFEAAAEVYQRGETEYRKIMMRLHSSRLPETRIGGALA